eukprot:TRINITY_DN6245_c0_g1_i2.p1 TRINITY_DN6245_c0_g1~~TRINITY_DN6245_c0_g1_i2.p1  ORF type:complete len:250 (-),score=24.38 TRINITY_DN6245_c0_g1_i2:69-818(-)
MEAQASARPKTLVAFDFDWSLLEANSDTWIVQKVAPSLYAQIRNAYTRGQSWASFMDGAMGQLFESGVKRSEVDEAFKAIPLRKEMIQALELCKAKDCDIVIISAANSHFIETILKHYGIREHFQTIHTHVADWDAQGRLRVSSYHNHPAQPEADACGRKHTCPDCPSDMCKGTILAEYMMYDRIFYIGDSTNDFCALTRLRPGDHAFVRQDYVLHEMLSDPKNAERVRGQVDLWLDAEKVRDLFATHL